MKTLISAMIGAFVLAACSTPAEKPQQSQPAASSEKPSEPRQASTSALAAKWVVVSFDKFTEKDLAGRTAFLDLTKMPKAHGKMGCNHLMLQAKEVGSGKIDFGPIATSMMLCEDMKLEEAFLNMRSVWNYRFDGDDLILEQNGKTMRLRREP
jgi:hypothetical protein